MRHSKSRLVESRSEDPDISGDARRVGHRLVGILGTEQARTYIGTPIDPRYIESERSRLVGILGTEQARTYRSR